MYVMRAMGVVSVMHVVRESCAAHATRVVYVVRNGCHACDVCNACNVCNVFNVYVVHGACDVWVGRGLINVRDATCQVGERHVPM